MKYAFSVHIAQVEDLILPCCGWHIVSEEHMVIPVSVPIEEANSREEHNTVALCRELGCGGGMSSPRSKIRGNLKFDISSLPKTIDVILTGDQTMLKILCAAM